MDKLSVKCLLYTKDRIALAPAACDQQEIVTKMNDSIQKRGGRTPIGRTVEGVTHLRLCKSEHFRHRCRSSSGLRSESGQPNGVNNRLVLDHSITHAAPRPSPAGSRRALRARRVVCGPAASRYVSPALFPTQISFRLFITRFGLRSVRSSRRAQPTSDPEVEVDTNPNREPTKRPYESHLFEELSSDSWSDDFNDINDSDEEGFTQVTKRKPRQPWLFATYESDFIQLSGKKLKASTSASPFTAPPLPRRPLFKIPIIQLSGAPSGSQTPRTFLHLKTLRHSSLRTRRRLVRSLRRRRQRPPKLRLGPKSLTGGYPGLPEFIRPTRDGQSRISYILLEFRVILRGVRKELPIKEVKQDLIIQNIPVQSVRRITNRAREPLDLVLITSNTTSIDNATKRQCFNGKLYGHSSKNCYQRVRCVKCLGNHGTTASTRNKDTDGPPACVLCKSGGHTANYLGYPRAPKRKPTLNNKKKTPPPVQTAPRRAPARTFMDNISHAKATAGSREDPPINSAPITSSSEDIKALMSMISIIDVGEIVLLANKFKTTPKPVEKILILAEHAPIVAIKNNKI
ncbi:hypothetical protein EVAR_14472_1 [Eumeta japonica]|uniref:Nucleic-acid-binding protein from transposon X-element n=1 Tax=Eumeta variegata TaxID=151549 RepID=A0A4C1U3R4_EUMVA|nr:hypothetical protein EVAR_14472_1 [Eumeta japonica]